MELLWILLLVVLALAVFGGLGTVWGRDRGDAVAGDSRGTGSGILGLVVVVIAVVLLISLLT